MSIKKNLKGWLAGRTQKDEAPEQATPARAAEAAEAPALEPEIVAVIAAVVAIEVKVFMALQGPHFTFGEGPQGQGWSDWGRLLVGPFQGVR